MCVCVCLKGSASDVCSCSGSPDICQQCKKLTVVGRLSVPFSYCTFACVVCVCLSVQAEQQLQKKNKGQPSEMLEKAAEHLMSCFRICASDKSVLTAILC